MLHRLVCTAFWASAAVILLLAMLSKTEAKKIVHILDEDNWRMMLKEEWMIEFYAPWCPACKNLASTWDEFSTWSDDLNIKTGKIDVTTSPALSGRFFVTALPTIFHVLNGEFRQYRGPRDLNSLMSFIEEKKWQSIEPISMWKKPDSIQMSIVSYFFKLSNYLKEINNHLLQDYGLPLWGSYGIFALATILIGAMLGLLLVCIIDLIYPPKNVHRQSFSESRKKTEEENNIEEIAGDELEDEADEVESSDAEKNSGSDSENYDGDDQSTNDMYSKSKLGSTKQLENKKETSAPSPEVRKRKPRKAD